MKTINEGYIMENKSMTYHLQAIERALQAAAQGIDRLNSDGYTELDNAAAETASALEWIDEALKRFGKRITRVKVTRTFYVDVQRAFDAIEADIEEAAKCYVYCAGAVSDSAETVCVAERDDDDEFDTRVGDWI